MREIIFDTETTGLDSSKDRIIEIGALEYDVNRFPTGRKFHHYINPDGMKMPSEAQKIHGITDAMLADKPRFADIVDEFLHFTDGALLIAHNAMFDLGFINAELGRCGKRPIDVDRIIDTLPIARRKHPGAQNTLDALCRRYGIDASGRILHGALLDAELLADVYVELIGGRQGALGLGRHGENREEDTALYRLTPRPRVLLPRLSAEEEAEHEQFLQKMAAGGARVLWYGGAGGKQG